MNKIIDGKAEALMVLTELQKKIYTLKLTKNVIPHLSIVLVGSNPSSVVYVNNKVRMAKKIGVNVEVHQLQDNVTLNEIQNLLQYLNSSNIIHGIIVQLPLPPHINSFEIINFISPEKDVDGFHALNVGYLNQGIEGEGFVSCTPLGCMHLLNKYLGRNNMEGKYAVIIGRSNIVGKPLAALMNKANATVTLCHSKTKNLKSITIEADILITAMGAPNFIDAEFVKENAVVIDVGITKVGDKLMGDINFDSVYPKAKYITPVPGGVGPMTVTYLLYNTYNAAYRSLNVIKS